MIGDTATEATIQDMVMPLDGEIHALADDLGARDVVGAQNPKAAELNFGGQTVDNPGDSGAVAE
jgi:hypothetical protein